MTMPKTSAEIQSLLEEMAETIREELADKDPLLVGIHTGGVWVAKALQNILGEDFLMPRWGH